MQDDVAQEVTPIAEHLPAPQLRRVLLIETNRGENEDLAHLHIFPLLAEAGKGNTPNLKKMLELQTLFTSRYIRVHLRRCSVSPCISGSASPTDGAGPLLCRAGRRG